MTVSLLPQQALPDALCCLGLGLGIAAAHDLLRLLCGGRAALFLLDLAAFLSAAVLLCSFSASRSAAGVPRWYFYAAMLAGAVGYSRVVVPVTERAAFWLRWLITRPFALAGLPLLALFGVLKRQANKEFAVLRRFRAQKRKNRLKKAQNVMYNSNV